MKAFISVLACILSFSLLPTVKGADFSDFTNNASQQFLDVDEAFKLSQQTVGDQVFLYWDIAPDYYLYKFQMKVEARDAEIAPLELPPGKPKHDEYFGDVEVYTDLLELPVTLTRAHGDFQLLVTYQGCTKGLCYTPQTKTLPLSMKLGKASTSTKEKSENTEKTFLMVDEAFVLTPSIEGNTVTAHWAIAPGYYLYRHSIQVKIDGETIESLPLPTGKPKTDEFFGNVEIYENTLTIPVTLDDIADVSSLTVRYQGCTDGLCYPPQTVDLLTAKNQDNKGNTQPTDQVTSGESEEQSLQSILENGSILLIIFTFAAVGLGLSLTPCVYPMYPVLSSIIIGQGDKLTTRRAFMLAFTYVQGVAATYMLLGVAIASLQVNVNAYFQQPIFVIPVLIILVLLALSMFGFYELQLPSFIRDRLNAVSNKQKGGSYGGVFVMGAISTLVLSPCTAAPLITAFGYIASEGDVVKGGLSLYAMGIGMGIPLMLIGLSGGELMPRAGAWMNAIKAGFGVAILAVALRLADPLLPGPVYLMLWSSLLITTALYMKIFVWPSENNWQTFWKGPGFVFFTYGIILLIGAAMGNGKITKPLEGFGQAAPIHYSNPGAGEDNHNGFKPVKSIEDVEREVAKAASQGKTVMLDFFAKWCTACFELANYTFPAPEVQAALSNTVLLKLDLSESNPTNRAIEKHFKAYGLPMILFYDKQGQELNRHRVTGFMDAKRFAAHVNQAFAE